MCGCSEPHRNVGRSRLDDLVGDVLGPVVGQDTVDDQAGVGVSVEGSNRDVGTADLLHVRHLVGEGPAAGVDEEDIEWPCWVRNVVGEQDVSAGNQGAAADTTESIDASGVPRPIEDAHPRSGIANPTESALREPTEEPAIRTGNHQLDEGGFDSAHPVGADFVAKNK